jgi:predicted nucleic acid-binding protein
MLDYEAICQLADHRLASALGLSEVEAFIEGLVALSTGATRHFRWRPQLRDPGDEMVLEAAVNGQAQALVTFNVRDYGAAPTRFGIDVFRPADLLRKIRM